MIEQVDISSMGDIKTSGRYACDRVSELESLLRERVDSGETLSFIEPNDDEESNPQLFRSRMRSAASRVGVKVNVRGKRIGEFVILRG